VSVPVVNGATEHDYRAAFVPAGPYTVAFTCDDDDATADEELEFSGAQDATVQSNLIGTVDFTAPPPG